MVEYIRCPWHALEALVGSPLRDVIEYTALETPFHKVSGGHDAHACRKHIVTPVAECRYRIMRIRIFEFSTSLRAARLRRKGYGCQKANCQENVFHNFKHLRYPSTSSG